jgi:hypothetical protein
MNSTEHLFSCLGEEGAEIAQDVSKINRFGLLDVNIIAPDSGTNKERLINELNDLIGIVEMLVERGILPTDWINREKINAKKIKVEKFMRYARKVGTLRGKK